MLHLMDDEELKFVIGHEIGHLISKNADLHKLINFVFPSDSTQPSLLQNKIRLWNQLSELIADRYGFLACPDLSKCISAFFKMSSGLDTHRVDLDIEAFLAENQQRLEFFIKENGLNIASHPVNPVRVKAIELFSRSLRFHREGLDAAQFLNEKEIEDQMDGLIQVLLKIRNSELDYHRMHFIAASGLIAASIDEELDDKELEMLTQTLSDFSIFPKSFLEKINESGKVVEVFNKSAKTIMEINPGEREGMLVFLIGIVMADKEISQEEVSFIFDVGEKVFGYTRKRSCTDFLRNNTAPLCSKYTEP
jgi:hypothetical protein